MIGKWTNWWKVETWGTELDSKCEKKKSLIKVGMHCI